MGRKDKLSYSGEARAGDRLLHQKSPEYGEPQDWGGAILPLAPTPPPQDRPEGLDRRLGRKKGES